MVRIISFGLLSLALPSATANLVSASPEVAQAFQDFVRDFDKQYSSEEDKEARFAIFEQNYALIQAENAKGHLYTLGVNAFADQTPQELMAERLGLRVPSPDELWSGVPSLGMHNVTDQDLPADVDWVQKGGVTPVKNQRQCGSCWAFSTTGAVEGAWFVATGKLQSLSEEQLLDCSHKGNSGCKGGIMEIAFQYLTDHPVCSEESYPYRATDDKVCHEAACTAAIPKGSIVGFKEVEARNTYALMSAVAQQPVSVSIEADQNAFLLYKSGVLTKQCGDRINHGVLAVGYGTENGVHYWKVKNSWGPGWGENGYIRLERGVAGTGECGIKYGPSYPVVRAGPPAPSDTYYGRPPCRSRESVVRVPGSPGVACAPPCDFSRRCPRDTPSGPRGQFWPECLLQSGGESYCALPCYVDRDCPSDATCADIGKGDGVCLYPGNSEGRLLFPFNTTDIVV